MNLDLLNERLQILRQNLKNTESTMNQLMADANAIHGAIQEIEFWIKYEEENNKKVVEENE